MLSRGWPANKPTNYELSNVKGINLIMDQGQEGGVNQSLNLDGHGKSWSSLILGHEVKGLSRRP